MAIEVLVMKIQRKNYYRLGDAINSTSVGVIDQLMAAAVGLGPGMLIYGVAASVSPFKFDAHATSTWILSLLIGDFIFYWWHRSCHRINFMWAGHVIHHQSEDYNLSTALRQSWATQVTAAFYFLPIALIGIPFEVYLGSLSLNLLYQFWIHTQVIGKLGPLEWVLNTPSHHRVHHGVNPEYLDKNYAGILIIWDRIFGTFEKEQAPVVYGTVKPIQTWNPVRNNLDYWIELVQRSRAERGGFLARAWHWFAPPEWSAAEPKPEMILKNYRPAGYKKFDVTLTRGQMIYASTVFLLLLSASALFLNFQDKFSVAARVGFLIFIILGLVHVSLVGRLKHYLKVQEQF